MESIYKYNIQIFLLIFILLYGCNNPSIVNVEINYPEDSAVENDVIFIPVNSILEKSHNFNKNNFIAYINDVEIPSQLCLTIDGEQIGVYNDFSKYKLNKIALTFKHFDGDSVYQYNKLTQAEIQFKTDGEFIDNKYVGGSDFKRFDYLRVPDECTDHSYFIKYEGPGWESEKVGYRFYLDWRNAVDIFGKKTTKMVLQDVGQDGYESYHEMSDWGMDILKVGNSLGIGSIAYWDGVKATRVEKTDSVICKILNDGPIYSAIQTDYFGWEIANQKINLTSILSINAGSRVTKCDIIIDKNLNNISTGLAIHPEAELILSEDSNSLNYMATWGKQSLNNDNLGMAIIYKRADKIEITTDELNHVVVLKPNMNKITYYFLAAWELEKDGIITKEDFINYLEYKVKQLSLAPININ